MSEPRDAVEALEVYVWFEADPADASWVLAAFGRLGAAMASGGSEAVAERPRLLRRPELVQRDGAPRTTWMEVWPGVPPRTLAGWLDRLDAAAASSGAGALARGGRHVEVFAPQARSRPG